MNEKRRKTREYNTSPFSKATHLRSCTGPNFDESTRMSRHFVILNSPIRSGKNRIANTSTVRRINQFPPDPPADHLFTGLKLSESILKSDLVKLLKSIPLHTLHQSTTPNALPTVLLTDLRYASLRPTVRDQLVKTHIASLPPAPSNVEISPEDQNALSKQSEERQRREQALADRQKQVVDTKRKQQGALRYSKEMLKEGAEEIQRAMKVGKGGLRSYMDVNITRNSDL